MTTTVHIPDTAIVDALVARLDKCSAGRATIYATRLGSSTRVTRRNTEIQAVNRLARQATGLNTDVCHHTDGAPYIPGFDGHVSVTHGASMAIMSVSHNCRTGIDAECWREQLVRVAPRFIRPEEMSVHAASPDCLLRAWTSKEAIFKALGISGITLIDICLPDRIEGLVTVSVDGHGTKDISLTFFGDMPVCVALAELM